MIQSVKVKNFRGEELVMELAHPENSGFNIYNIDGIGPPTAVINMTEMATLDGSIFTSASANHRNIVFFIKYQFDPTIESARHKSYRYFPIKTQVELTFYTDERTVKTSGYVETNTPAIFEKEEYTQISILCPESFFEDAGVGADKLVVFYGINPTFEFPFENNADAPDPEFNEVATIPTSDLSGITNCTHSSLGNYLAVSDANNIHVYNTQDNSKVSTIQQDGIVADIDWGLNDTCIASACNIRSGLSVEAMDGKDFFIPSGSAVEFSSDGLYLACGYTSSPFIRVYKRVANEFVELEITDRTGLGRVTSISWSRDGRYLAYGFYGSSVYSGLIVYERSGDTFTKALDNTEDIPSLGTVFGCSFSPNGTYLACAGTGIISSGTKELTVYKISPGNVFTALSGIEGAPDYTGYDCTWSPDSTYLTVVGTSAETQGTGMAVYKRSGDTFTKLPGLEGVNGLPGGGQSCSFSSDGVYLACVTSYNLVIYKRSGDTFNRIEDIRDVGGGERCSFSPDGRYLACVRLSSPFLTIYQHSGDAFIKLSGIEDLSGEGYGLSFSIQHELAIMNYNSITMTEYLFDDNNHFIKQAQKVFAPQLSVPLNYVYGCAVTRDGNYLAAVHDASPYITTYKLDRSTNIFMQLSGMEALPFRGLDCCWSPDGTYLVASFTGRPYFTIYKRNGDAFTKLTQLPAVNGYCNEVQFSPDGLYLAIASSVSPGVVVLKRNGDAFTQLPDPTSTTLLGESTSCAWSHDGRFLAVGQNTMPAVTVYELQADTLSPTLLHINANITAAEDVSWQDSSRFGVASNSNPYFTAYELSINQVVHEPVLEFGEIVSIQQADIEYAGDASTGIRMEINATGPVGDITIYKYDPDGMMSILADKLAAFTGSSLVAGDRITIDTRVGHKAITLLRGGVETNILSALNRGAMWFQLYTGHNLFSYAVSEGLSNLEFTISYKTLFEGV